MPRYTPHFRSLPLLAFIGLLSVLVHLGIWQLDRAQQKQDYLNQQQQALASGVIDLFALPLPIKEDLRYRQVKVTGHYDDAHQILLDNQISEGKAGYFVLTPFIFGNQNQAVLVNRGWLPVGKDRAMLPDVAIKQLEVTINGRINHYPSIGLVLPQADQPDKGWPTRVQVLNNRILSEKLGYPLLQFQVELAEDQADGYKRSWQTTSLMLPEQHKAYAFQWFALATALSLLFIRYSFKKINV
ncbi:hypothetical protein JCM14076_17180 [Methylosoma difficile]